MICAVYDADCHHAAPMMPDATLRYAAHVDIAACRYRAARATPCFERLRQRTQIAFFATRDIDAAHITVDV